MKTTHLYIASCVPQGGVVHYIRREGERWQPRDRFQCDRPMYMIPEGDRMHILLRAPFPGRDESGLVTCAVGPDGSLVPLGPPEGTRGQVACHLCRFQDRTYVTNYISGSVYAFSGQLCVHQGRGPHPTRQEGPHTHYISPTPDGKYLMSTDLGLDTVFVYDRDLNEISRARVPAGQGCRHLACSEDLGWVFCANELGSTVSVFAYLPGRLRLTETVGALFAPDPDNTAAAIRVRGDWVYVSQRGKNAVSCLKWDGQHLSLRAVCPCGGDSPRDILPVGEYVLCANEKSDQVTFLRMTGEGLALTDGSLPVKAPLCLAVREI